MRFGAQFGSLGADLAPCLVHRCVFSGIDKQRRLCDNVSRTGRQSTGRAAAAASRALQA